MSQHTRNSQSKKKQTLPKRRLTRPSSNRVQKKTKKIGSSPTTNARPKRLSGLTANTLLEYCSNLLSPTPSDPKKTTNKKRANDSLSPPTKKAKVENEPPPAARTRREASSRASALILQQNEIERSRFNFPLAQESNSRRVRTTKSPVPPPPAPEPFQFNIPAPPVPPSKFPPLTEALLAEHDRLLGTIPSYHLSKRDNLLKWTQELGAFEHSSPPSPTWNDKEAAAALPFHRSLSFSFEQSSTPCPTFLPPSTSSSTFPLDFPSFYPHPLLPCWQYPAWLLSATRPASEALALHLHTHHHHHHVPSANDELVQKKAVEPFHLDHGTGRKKKVVVTRASRASRSRGQRTVSSSTVPPRPRSTGGERKRSHSAASVTHERKKQKIFNHWILAGRFERKLVTIKADQPAVYRKCFSSIRHVQEKEIIRSNDCVILRPADAATRQGGTPYLAKVQSFWEEPISGEILMSLMWFYHPEHTELSSRVKEQFLPAELLASKYSDCINVACIEDKCYVLTLNEYNRFRLREQPIDLFSHSENVQQLKHLLNKNTPTAHHRALPAKSVDNQNVFFARYVYDYRAKRLVKNPSDAKSDLSG